MNWLSCLAGLLTAVATVVHGTVGAKEFNRFKPPPGELTAHQSWTQSLAGWHWVSFDLAFTTLGFITFGLTDWINHESQLLKITAIYFIGTGAAWLMTIHFGEKEIKNRHVVLGQWMFCWIVAVVAWLASFN